MKKSGLIFVGFALVGVSVAIAAALGFWIWRIDQNWSPLVEPRLRERQQVGSIRVLAQTPSGETKWIGSLNAGRMEERQPLRLDEVPPLLVQSIVVLEDPRFLDHVGFDIWGILRAALVNMRKMRVAQGGSTITQQLVKNIFLTNERTLSRKFTELILAALVEKRFSKDEILEAYMNEVYLGQLGSVEIRGVGRAAEYYFGKKADQLELPEMALLAAMIAGPGVYSPWKAPEKTKARRDRVLRSLLDHSLILPEEYDRAIAQALPGPTQFVAPVRAAYLIDALRERLFAEHGEAELMRGGFDVTLSLDLDLQETAEKTLAEAGTGWEPAQQGLLVAADPRDCRIRLYVGGTDYRITQLDRVRQSRRPIGSLMKPLEVAPLLEFDPQLNLATKLDDQPLDWNYDQGRGRWKPSNYDEKFRGAVSLRHALEESLNVPIARIFFERAPEGTLADILDPLKAMGLDIPADRALPSAVLGAIDQTPIQTLTAFVKLARRTMGLAPDAADLGCRLDFLTPKVAKEVDGNSSADEEPEAPLALEDAFGQKGARLTVAALEGALRRGTSRALGTLLPVEQQWAGKTGTSSDKRDSWYVALSPQLVVLGWVGRDDNLQTGLTGASGAMPLVRKVVLRYSARETAATLQWPAVPVLQWKVVSTKDFCRPANISAQLIESSQTPTTTPPPAPFRYQNTDYVMELFREDAMPPECR